MALGRTIMIMRRQLLRLEHNIRSRLSFFPSHRRPNTRCGRSSIYVYIWFGSLIILVFNYYLIHLKITEFKEPELSELPEPVQIITRSEIIDKGPIFNDHHSWNRYRYAILYGEGVPREKEAFNFRDGQGNAMAYEGYDYSPPDISLWESNSTLWDRKGRFPSVQDRIKFYMGSWYDPPSNITSEEFWKMTQIYGKQREDIRQETALNYLDLNPEEMFKCWKRGWEDLCQSNPVYLIESINIAILHRGKSAPILFRYNDATSAANHILDHSSCPIFGKVRDNIAENDEVHHQRYPPTPNCKICGGRLSSILWPFNGNRHFSPAAQTPMYDIPWEDKKGMLAWRGGAHMGINIPAMVKILPIEISTYKQRMALVGNHLNSTLVDAKFIKTAIHLPDGYVSDFLSMDQLLQYKYLMSVEGNDVSSGLKWMLFSNSVVFCPPFTYDSWAMESLLEPFVHYIPVYPNMSNVEEMVLWAESHEEEVRKIRERSTLFVYDLLFHPDAYRDEELVMEGIMRQYENNFGRKQIDEAESVVNKM